jgi:hypothetical protein
VLTALHDEAASLAGVRSGWRINGGPLEDLIRVLGHTSKAMTEHYANVGGYHRPQHFGLFP